MKRTLFIANPISGSGRGRAAVDAVTRKLSNAGPMDTVLTGARGDAERAARGAASTGYERVVVAGGDGTINEIVNGLACTDVECGIIPVGTANVLARDLGLPINDPEAAAEIVLNGTPRRIDLGLAGSRYYAAMAGFGFDAAVVHRVEPKVKRLIGPGAYFLSIAGELIRHKPARFVLDIDDRTIEVEAFIVVVANTSSYAYGIKVAPHASLDNGRLDVIIFEKAKPAKIGFLQQAARVMLHTHLLDPNVRSLGCRKVSVQSDPPVLMQVDGDEAGKTPTTVEVVPGALTVIVGKGVGG